MKTKLIAIATLGLAFSTSAFASQATLTGVLTDSMCIRKHMTPGKPNSDCVRDCIEHGSKYVVITDGKVIELKGKQELVSKLAGKKVNVIGDLAGIALTVSSIKEAQ